MFGPPRPSVLLGIEEHPDHCDDYAHHNKQRDDVDHRIECTRVLDRLLDLIFRYDRDRHGHDDDDTHDGGDDAADPTLYVQTCRISHLLYRLLLWKNLMTPIMRPRMTMMITTDISGAY